MRLARRRIILFRGIERQGTRELGSEGARASSVMEGQGFPGFIDNC